MKYISQDVLHGVVRIHESGTAFLRNLVECWQKLELTAFTTCWELWELPQSVLLSIFPRLLRFSIQPVTGFGVDSRSSL